MVCKRRTHDAIDAGSENNDLMHFTCICCTFGRVEYLNEAIQCFLNFDYQEKTLIVYNTFLPQQLHGNFPNVKIVNAPFRPSSLGGCRNEAIALAPEGSVIITHDDDDLYLPNHLSNFADNIEGNEWLWMDKQYWVLTNQIKSIVPGAVNLVGFTKSAWKSVGGYPLIDCGEDRGFIAKLTQLPGKKVQLQDSQISFLYHWAQGDVYHTSGLGNDVPNRPSGHDRIAAWTEDRVRSGAIPIGSIELKPNLKHDYIGMAKAFLESKSEVSDSKKNSTCIVQLGRLGDIINILPVAKHIADTSRKPWMLVSREFESVLDGVSYVNPYPVDLAAHQLDKGLELARKEFGTVIQSQIWGSGYKPEHKTASWNMESWAMAGFGNKFNDKSWKLVFDRRNKERESELIQKLTAGGRPLMLVKVTKGLSSSFPRGEDLLRNLREKWGGLFKIVDFANFVLERAYDLIGIMEASAMVVSIDTALLHLAAATDVPVVALVNEAPWLGSMLRCNCVARLPYDVALSNFNTVHDAIAEGIRTWAPKHRPDLTSNAQWRMAFPITAKHGTITIRRTGALGDVLAATCVADKLAELGHEVTFQAHEATHPILRRCPSITTVTIPHSTPDINLDGAYENDPNRRTKHFSEIFLNKASSDLNGSGIDLGKIADFAPRIYSNLGVKQEVLPNLEKYPKPWIMICPRSESWVNRTVPNDIWGAVANQLPGTKFWLGRDVSPPNIVNLNCHHVDLLIEYLACADLLISTDTGPAHISLALGTPLVVIEQASSPNVHFSDQRDWVMVSPDLNCLNCQTDPCPLDPKRPPCQQVPPKLISDAANERLRSITTDSVSAVICIFKPNIDRLNKCLDRVLPQVNEVVIVGDLDTPWPLSCLVSSPKIKLFRKNKERTGYGKKANYGMRHSNGKYVMLLNDDVFLQPDVVAKLVSEMRDNVAIVSHLLYYPNGTIQYAGKHRRPGDLGFGHIDLRERVTRHERAVEEESVCGASILVRRRAFYQVGGFCELFYLYGEDDDLAMRLRQAGWKIVFTPEVFGIHEEHQSTNITPNMQEVFHESHELGIKRWAWYFKKNVNTFPGTFT